MDRLTKKYSSYYGLVKVKDNEQEVDSPYPNTLKAILESFSQLGKYEDTGLTPAEIDQLKAENAELKAELQAYKDKLAKVIKQINAEIEECELDRNNDYGDDEYYTGAVNSRIYGLKFCKNLIDSQAEQALKEMEGK